MRVIDLPMKGLQSELKDFYAGCCNVESIIVCDLLMSGKKADRDTVYATLARIAINPREYGCSVNGYVNNSSTLLSKIGSSRVEIFRDSIEAAKTSKFWIPGAYAVARFRNGTIEHSVVIKVLNAHDYAVVYDGYGLSNAVRYGFINSIRFYA